MMITRNLLFKMLLTIGIAVALWCVSPPPGSAESILMNIDLGSRFFAKPDAGFVELDKQHFNLQTSKNLEILVRNMTDNPSNLALHIEMLSALFKNDVSQSAADQDLLAYLQKVGQAVEDMRDQIDTAKISMAFIHATALELGITEQEEPWIAGIKAICEERPAMEEGSMPWPQLIAAYVCAAVPDIGSADELLRELEAHADNISDPQFLYALGQAFLTLYHGQPDPQLSARDILEKALEESGYQPGLLQAVIDRYMAGTERYQEQQEDPPPWLSEILYVKMLDLDPDDAVAHNNLGYLYSSLGVKLDQALFHVKKANELSPNNPYFLDSLGWVLFRRGESKEALEVLKKALEINDAIPEIYEHISSVYLNTKSGDREALKALERLLELSPDNTTALNNLGYMYADLDIDYEEALKLTKRAVELKPDDPYYLDSLGWAYFKLGDTENARKYLKQSIAIDDEQTELLDHLGDVDLVEGKLDAALDYYVTAAGFNPEYDRIHQKIGVIYTIRQLNRTVAELEASQAAGETVEIDGLSNALRALSYHYRMSGLFEESMRAYQRVAELNPGNGTIAGRLERIRVLNEEVENIKNLLSGVHGEIPECGSLEPYIAPLPEGVTILFVLRAGIMAEVLESVKSFFSMFSLIDFEQAAGLLPPVTTVAVVEKAGETNLAIISELREDAPIKKALTLLLSGTLNHLFPDLEISEDTIGGRTVTALGSTGLQMYLATQENRLVASNDQTTLTAILDNLAPDSEPELRNAALRRLFNWAPDNTSATVYLDLARWLPRLGTNAVQLVRGQFPMADEVMNVALSYKVLDVTPIPDSEQAGPVKPELTMEEHAIFLCRDRHVPEKLASTISTVLDHYNQAFGQAENGIDIDHSFQFKAKYLIYSATVQNAGMLRSHVMNTLQSLIPRLPELLQGTTTGESEEPEESAPPLDPTM